MFGKLKIKPIAAKLTRDTELFGKMDPYVRIKLGDEEKKSSVQNSAGKFPSWKDEMIFQRRFENFVEIEVWDYDTLSKDDLVGEVRIPLQKTLDTKKTDEWYELTYHGKNAGQIRIEMNWELEKVDQNNLAPHVLGSIHGFVSGNYAYPQYPPGVVGYAPTGLVPSGYENNRVPSQPGYPPTGYPPNYSSIPGQPNYPPAGQPNYPPPGQPNYPPSGQHNYPPSGQPNYPPSGQPNYPPGQPNRLPPGQPNYPPSGQPNYPPSGQPNYPPPGQPNYPPAGQLNYPPSGQPNYPPPGQTKHAGPQGNPNYPPSNQPHYSPPGQPNYTPPGQPNYPPPGQPNYPPYPGPQGNYSNPNFPGYSTVQPYNNNPGNPDPRFSQHSAPNPYQSIPPNTYQYNPANAANMYSTVPVKSSAPSVPDL